MASTETKGRCNLAPPPLHPSDQWVPIGTGNYYKGEWNHRAMSGNGVYVMSNGTVYKGDLDDGLFHGTGVVYNSSGSRLEGLWDKGKCVEKRFVFSDGLAFQPDDWKYCTTSDRRFVVEYTDGLEPAAKSRITNRHPTLQVPDGEYDAGDGFYQPLTNTVHDYWTNEVIRIPTVRGGEWIVENCRRGGDNHVGFRPELFEKWYGTAENDNNNRHADACDDDDQSDETAAAVVLSGRPVDHGNDETFMISNVRSVLSSMFDFKTIWSKRGNNPSSNRELSSTSSTDDELDYCQKIALTAQNEDTRSFSPFTQYSAASSTVADDSHT